MRFVLKKGKHQAKVDVTREALRKEGIWNIRLGEPLILVPNGEGYLVTEAELLENETELVEDISEDKEKLRDLVTLLKNTPWFVHQIFTIENIYDYSKKDFLQDKTYQVELIHLNEMTGLRTFQLRLPDGVVSESYGLVRTTKPQPQYAKEIFHSRAVSVAKDNGRTLPDYIMKDYPVIFGLHV